MLHKHYLLLFVVALILFSPQAAIVLAEETGNESVYETIEQEQSKDAEAAPIDQIQSKEPAAQDNAVSVSAFDFIKMLMALAFVLLLIYFLLKFVTKRNNFFQQGQIIVNLGGTSLGQNKSIQMIKVGKRLLVVGVGESISLLKEIDDEEERIELVEEFERKKQQMVEPKDFIQKLILKQNRKLNETTNQKAAFSSSFKDQLEKVKKERKKQLEDVKRKGINKHE
ncbi:flagellar biosynthetic protein FliO [Metabacillus sp. Hm71]|uniref:flagellar biosynthetic protein FliO n=1 Tax=Metabacillus sp. Hm71 TaxID=3450743 RepID=UPI003F422240